MPRMWGRATFTMLVSRVAMRAPVMTVTVMSHLCVFMRAVHNLYRPDSSNRFSGSRRR